MSDSNSMGVRVFYVQDLRKEIADVHHQRL
jgi:hypothetical protein